MYPLFVPCNFALTPSQESIYLTSSNLKIGNYTLPVQETHRFGLFGDILVLLSTSGARFINTPTTATLFFYPGLFYSAAFYKNFFFLGASDGSIHRLSFVANKFVFDRKFPKLSDSSIVALLPLSADLFIFGDEFGKVEKFPENFSQPTNPPLNGFPLVFFKVDNFFVVVSSGGQLTLHPLESLRAVPACVVQSHGRSVHAAATSGEFIALGGEDGIVNVWKIEEARPQLVKSERVTDGLIVGLAFSGERAIKGICYDRESEWEFKF